MLNGGFVTKIKEFDVHPINYCSVNVNYLGFDCESFITFYDMKNRCPSQNEYFNLNVDFQLFELNQKFPQILLVINCHSAEIYELPVIFNQLSIKLNPKFKYNEHKNYITISKFNPNFSHVIATISGNILHIWNIKKYTNNTKLSFKNRIIKFKWEERGILFCIYDKNNLIIYNRAQRLILNKYTFDLNINHKIEFNFLNQNNIIILLININKNKTKVNIFCFEENKVKIEVNLDFITYNFIKTDDYLIFQNGKNLNIYDFNLKLMQIIKVEYMTKIVEIKNPLNKSNNNEIEILSLNNQNISIINISEDIQEEIYNESKMINLDNKIKKDEKNDLIKKSYINNNNIIKEEIISEEEPEDESEEERFVLYDEEDNLEKDYFEGCLQMFPNISGILKYENNENKNIYLINKKKKAYLEIDIIKKELENQSKNLIELKNIVAQEIKKENKFTNIEDEYLFYIKLLVKDETNKILLKKYLNLLKRIEEEKYNLQLEHENYSDELNYYLVLFNKKELNEFNIQPLISEKKKFIELLINIKKNIEENTFQDYKDKLESINFIYNQPFMSDSEDIMFYICRIFVLENIQSLKVNKTKGKDSLNIIKYVIERILNENIIETINSPDILIPLTNLIDNKESKNRCDFFLNMIESNRLNDEELDKIVKSNNYEIIQDKGHKVLMVNTKLYFNPNEICFSNFGNNSYNSKELYNFNYLKNNPPINIDINKIRKFLQIVFSSKVFKDLFSLLTGKQDYDKIFNLNMINFIIDNIKFLPLNFEYIAGFFDKLSLTTYISTMNKVINCYANKNIPKDVQIILENGVIIGIIFHELGHMISAIICYTDNLQSLINTPRKKKFKINEGGYYVEMALFGKIIKKLTLEESLYLLNLKNYEKSLEDFRTGFEKLEKKDLEINGVFSEFKLDMNNELDKDYGKKFSISTKPKDNNKKNIEIIIPFLNDVKGRDFTKEDLLFYSNGRNLKE